MGKSKGKARAAKRHSKVRNVSAQASKGSVSQKKASLQFPPGHGRSGLTPSSLSVGNENAAIVREILQNSLDAVRNRGEECAHVRFSLENILVADIPGITEYKEAVDSIAKDCERKEWQGQNKEIVNGFRAGLKKQTLPVLFVSDNGTGLDQISMTAILSDGASEKGGEEASGSHGNGHFTIFYLSKMRYVLYGGVSKKGEKLVSGHAFLANHRGKDGIRDAHGYFLTDFVDNPNEPDKLYEFPENKHVPPLLLKRLETIESEWGTGTVLAVVDFNFFEEEERSKLQMEDIILCAAARNFFVAIEQGELQITVKKGEKEWNLTKDNLGDIFENVSPNVPHTARLPSHNIARQFYALLSDYRNKKPGAEIREIKTDCGSFQFLFRQEGVRSTQIALCRNGMWITKDIPSVKSRDFVDNVPFEGLLLCDVNSKELHSLVRKAEGNLHNFIYLKQIKDSKNRIKLRNALQETARQISDFIHKQDDDVLDVLEINSESIEPYHPKRERIGTIGTSRGGGNGGSGSGSSGGGGKKSKPSPGRSLLVRSVAVKKGNSIKIYFMPQASSPDAELKLTLNGGSDISCSGSEDTSIEIEKAIYEDGTPCSVTDGLARLGEITQGESKTLTVEFHPTIKIKTNDYRVDCQFTRRAASNQDATIPPMIS